MGRSRPKSCHAGGSARMTPMSPEQTPPARPHHRFTADGRRMREVLSYSRRGSRFTPSQQRAWDAHHQAWVIPDEAVDEAGFRLAPWFGREAPAGGRDRLRGGGGDRRARRHPPVVRRAGAGGLEARRRRVPGRGGRRRRDERAVLLGRRRVGGRAPRQAGLARRALDVLPRPVAQGPAPQAAARERVVRRAGRVAAVSGSDVAAGHRLGRLRRPDARGPRRRSRA